MAQFLRPTGGIAAGGGISVVGAATAIDETTYNDTDYVYSTDNTSGYMEISLTTPSATPKNGAVTLRFRQAQCDGGVAPSSGGSASTIDSVALYQGAVFIEWLITSPITSNEGSFAPASASITANGISGWANLKVRINITGGGGSPSSRRGVAISWLELETSDPAVVIQQQSYRWRDDNGSESAASWLETANTAHGFNVGGGNVQARLRFLLKETSAVGGSLSPGLVYSLNGSLNTPADFSYDSLSLNVTSQAGSNACHAYWAPNGLKIYVVRDVGTVLTCWQYVLTTAWDISTASYSASHEMPTLAESIWWKEDGTKYFVWTGAETGYFVSCSTPFDITTSSTDSPGETDMTGSISSASRGVSMSPDGKTIFVFYSLEMQPFYLTTAWSLADGFQAGPGYDFSNGEAGGALDRTGRYIYGTNDGTNIIYVYRLGSPGEMSSWVSTPIASIDVSSLIGSFNSISVGGVGHQFLAGHASSTSPIFYSYSSADFSGFVGASTKYVKYFDSANLTNGADTTQQVGSGTFLTDNNGVSEDGVAGPTAFAANNEAEVEYTVEFVSSDLSDADVVRFQVDSTTSFSA